MADLGHAPTTPGKQFYDLHVIFGETGSEEQKACTVDFLQDKFLWILEFIYTALTQLDDSHVTKNNFS